MFVLPLQTFVHASQIFLSSEQALLSLTITLKAAPYELIRETTYQSELLLLIFLFFFNKSWKTIFDHYEEEEHETQQKATLW